MYSMITYSTARYCDLSWYIVRYKVQCGVVLWSVLFNSSPFLLSLLPTLLILSIPLSLLSIHTFFCLSTFPFPFSPSSYPYPFFLPLLLLLLLNSPLSLFDLPFPVPPFSPFLSLLFLLLSLSLLAPPSPSSS